jgi:hypothetical protein
MILQEHGKEKKENSHIILMQAALKNLSLLTVTLYCGFSWSYFGQKYISSFTQYFNLCFQYELQAIQLWTFNYRLASLLKMTAFYIYVCQVDYDMKMKIEYKSESSTTVT